MSAGGQLLVPFGALLVLVQLTHASQGLWGLRFRPSLVGDASLEQLCSSPFPFSCDQQTGSGIFSWQRQRNKKSVGIMKASQGLCFSRFRSWRAVASTFFCWPNQITCSGSKSRRREEAQLSTERMTKGMNRGKVKNWDH